MAELQELVSEYRSLFDVPEDKLKDVGFRRIADGKKIEIVADNQSTKRKGMAKLLLGKKYKDYLYSHAREDLRSFLCDKIDLSWQDLFPVFKRARKLQEAGVPGIFKEGFEGRDKWEDPDNDREYFHFPSVDFILNLFGWRSRGKRNPVGKSYAIEARLTNILQFRDYAIRGENTLDERVAKELVVRTENLNDLRFRNDSTRAYVLRGTWKVAQNLAMTLSAMPRSSSFELIDETTEHVKTIVKKPFWYAQLTEDAIDDVLKRYIEFVKKGFMDSDGYYMDSFISAEFGSRNHHAMMMQVFPDIQEEFEELRVKGMYKERPINFSGNMSYRTLMSHCYNSSRYKASAEVPKWVNKKIKELRDYARPWNYIREKLSIPSIDPEAPGYVAIALVNAIHDAKEDEFTDFSHIVSSSDLYQEHQIVRDAVFEKVLSITESYNLGKQFHTGNLSEMTDIPENLIIDARRYQKRMQKRA